MDRSTKPLAYSKHAARMLAERDLRVEWVERAVRHPDWIEPESARTGHQRRFKVLPDCGDRVLRVVCVETETEIRVITAFLDRRARRIR